MEKIWSVWGVLDVCIVKKLSEIGKIFGLIRLFRVENKQLLIRNICTIWIGNYHYFASITRFLHADKNLKPTMEQQVNQDHNWSKQGGKGKGGGNVKSFALVLIVEKKE